MNTKSTWIVLIIALGLGCYFLFFETGLLSKKDPTQPGNSTDTTPNEGSAIFTHAFTKNNIQSLTIEKPDQPAIVVTKIEGQWQQTKPVQFNLRQWEIDALVKNTSQLRYTNLIDATQQDITLASLGLEPALVSFALTGTTDDADKKPIKHIIKLGRTVAAGRAYLMVEGRKQIYIVSDDLHKTLITQSFNELRDKALATINVDRVKTITLQQNQQPAIALSQKEGRWSVTAPFVGRADKTKASELAQLLSFTAIRSFVTDQPSDMSQFGFDHPTALLTLDMTTSDNSPTEPAQYKLTVGSKVNLTGQQYFAMFNDSPVVFTIAREIVARLQIYPLDLRDPKLTDALRANIKQITLEQPGQTKVTLLREQGVWVFGDPKPTYQADGQIVNHLLDTLFKTKSIRGEIVTQPKPMSMPKNPVATVTLDIAGSDKPVKLTISKQNNLCKVITTGETYANFVNANNIRPLFGDTLFFRNRIVCPLVKDNIAEIRIYRLDHHSNLSNLFGSPTHEYKRVKGIWQLDEYDATVFGKLLTQLSPLQATQWQPDATLEKDRTIDTIDILIYVIENAANMDNYDNYDKSKLKTYLLVIDPVTRIATCEIEDASVPIRKAVDMPFMVSQELADLLTGELRDRTINTLDINDIKSVSSNHWTIERNKTGQYLETNGLDIDQSKAGQLFDALAGLQAQRWTNKGWITEADTELTLTTIHNQQYTLKLWLPKNNETVATGKYNDGKTFLLSRKIANQLATTPVVPPEK